MLYLTISTANKNVRSLIGFGFGYFWLVMETNIIPHYLKITIFSRLNQQLYPTYMIFYWL